MCYNFIQLPSTICSHCILYICNISLFSRFGFKKGICLLIAPVPVHSYSITFIDPMRQDVVINDVLYFVCTAVYIMSL